MIKLALNRELLIKPAGGKQLTGTPDSMRPNRNGVNAVSNRNYLSFKNIPQDVVYKKEKAYKSGSILKNGLNTVFQFDRDNLSQGYFGEIKEETKFAKPGWYFYKKQNTLVSEKLRSMNPRKYVLLYNDFYDKELKSAYAVARNEHKYVDNDINRRIKDEFAKNGTLDGYFEQRLDEYFLNYNEKKQTYDVRNEAYVTAHKNEFLSSFRKNPLHMEPECVQNVISITQEMLSHADKNTYLALYKDLDGISEALYKHDQLLLIESFSNLSQKIIPYWESEILRKKAENIEGKNRLVLDFKQSDTYRAMNQTKQMDLLFSNLSLDEKAFFAEKISDINSPVQYTTQNFLDFLINSVPSITKKREIINRVMQKIQIADSNFKTFKDSFIDDVRNKKQDSVVISKELNGKSVGKIVADLLPEREDYMINTLDEYTDEDLNKILDTLKPLWLDTKYKEACEEEETKYDMADGFEKILASLTMKINGKDVGIYEFMDSAFQKLYGENAKLGEISQAQLQNILAGRAEIKAHDQKNDLEYKYIMEQLESLVDMLYGQSQDSRTLHLEISKVLDKLEKTFPDQSRDLVYVRTKFERIRDGLKNSLFPAALSASTGYRAIHALKASKAAEGTVAAGAACGDPIMLSILALMYAAPVYSNIKKELEKPC